MHDDEYVKYNFEENTYICFYMGNKKVILI